MESSTDFYQKLFNAYKKAHPSLKGAIAQQNVNKEWADLKKEVKEGNLTRFNEKINELKLKAAKVKSGSSIWTFFGNTKSRPASKPCNSDASKNEVQVDPSKNNELNATSSSSVDTKPMTMPNSDATTSEENRNKTILVRTPAQDLIKKDLDTVNAKIASVLSVKKTVGLSTELKTDLGKWEKEKESLEKKLKRKMIDQKSQIKAREKKAKKIDQMLAECEKSPETITKKKAGRPRLEETGLEGLAEAIYKIVVPDGAADEKRRTETISTLRTVENLKVALALKGYHLSKTALYYRLLPANINHIDGKRHFSTVNVRLCKPQNTQRKGHPDGHFASASVKMAKDLANLFSAHSFFLSQDDKARVPIGLPISKKQTAFLMHLDYKVTLPDHDFPIGENHKLIPSVYAACLHDKEGSISYSGPTHVAIRSAKHNQSSAESHISDLKHLLTLDAFKEHAFINDKVKPLFFLSVDGGPDESPKNVKTLNAWATIFKELDLDGLFIFTHAPGLSAYNPVERRMAPLSKLTASVILPFDSFGSHLDSSNKTIDLALEEKNFEAAGNILAEVFNGNKIDGYDVSSVFVSELSKNMCVDLSEDWKSVHVMQSQYLCQIVKCEDISCCKPFRSNYDKVFPQHFIPPPIPVKACAEGLKVDASGHFGSLFQALYFNSTSMKATCFDEHCPTLSAKKDKKGVSVLERRMCRYCKKYHSTIKSKNIHQRQCRIQNRDGHVEEEEEKEEDEQMMELEDCISVPACTGRNIFEIIEDAYGI